MTVDSVSQSAEHFALTLPAASTLMLPPLLRVSLPPVTRFLDARQLDPNTSLLKHLHATLLQPSTTPKQTTRRLEINKERLCEEVA